MLKSQFDKKKETKQVDLFSKQQMNVVEMSFLFKSS